MAQRGFPVQAHPIPRRANPTQLVEAYYEDSIVIEIETRRRKVHKAVLAGESPVFAALFSNGRASLVNHPDLVISTDVADGCRVLYLSDFVEVGPFDLFSKALYDPG